MTRLGAETYPEKILRLGRYASSWTARSMATMSGIPIREVHRALLRLEDRDLILMAGMEYDPTVWREVQVWKILD